MDTPCGEGARCHSVVAAAATMRRGSSDDSAVSLRPHLRTLAHRRRSVPALAFERALGMPWSPIRSVLASDQEEASRWPSLDQCPFVLGLSSENGELLLDQLVQVTEGNQTKERHLFLFNNVLVFAKLKSSASYRLKHRVRLEDIWVYSFDDDDEDDEEAGGNVDLRVTLVLAWAPTFCIVSFCSPGVKERWLDTLLRKIIEARATSGATTPTPHALMKVLSGTIMNKTSTGVGMEHLIEFQSEADLKQPAPGKPPAILEDRLTQPIENAGKWNIIRRVMKGLTRQELDSGAQLFGQPLSKICPDTCSLPKPLTDMLVLLRRKAPSTEGVFRKPGNTRITRELREQLDAGQEVDLEGLPVVLLVALLKCFLKELPGSLLVSDLYVPWVKALDADEGQQRSSQIKRVLGQLPVHNRLLLQQLLGVLRHVLERSDTNKMDAHNLAVCTAPTLLQLNATPLEEQKERLEKVTELTQYLIEHSCELLGENVLRPLGDTEEDNSDALSSQLHDSAYDSTDPEAEADPAEGEGSVAGSSRSLPCSTTSTASSLPSCSSEAFAKPTFNRRCSEPILKALCPPWEAIPRAGLSGLARSQDDCSLESRGVYEQQPLKKQISDDSVLIRTPADPAAPALVEGVAPLWKALHSSTGSLESAASNQSEGSVFSNSPPPSPTCQRKWSSIRQPRWGATPRTDGGPVPDSEGKHRTQSMKLGGKDSGKTLKKAAGFSFRKSSLKAAHEAHRDTAFTCGTLRKDSQPGSLRRPRPLSAIEVFQLPCQPPSYEQAVHSAGPPAASHRHLLTVQDAQREQVWRAPRRPASMSDDFLSSSPVNRYADCFPSAPAAEEVRDEAGERRRPFRQRATSESAYRAHLVAAAQSCSQPALEEYSYAKESYI